MTDQNVVFERARKIGDIVKQRPGTSCIELRELLPWFSGDLMWTSKEDPNVVFWSGVSQEFIDAFREAEGLGLVHLEPAHVLTYLVDGGGLKLPVVRGKSKVPHKTPHWLPLVLVPGQVTVERVKEVTRRRVRYRELKPPKESDVTRHGLTFTPGERPEEEAIERSIRWIRSHTISTRGRGFDAFTSYGFKHMVERGCKAHGIEEGYVPNGAFIVAAMRSGARVFHMVGSKNAVFDFKLDPKRSCKGGSE